MGNRRLLTACCLALFFTLCCCVTVAPPEDFPVIPMPEKVVPESVSGTRHPGGIFLPEAEYKKAVKAIQELLAERDALRRVIDEYNRWAKSRSGP